MSSGGTAGTGVATPPRSAQLRLLLPEADAVEQLDRAAPARREEPAEVLAMAEAEALQFVVAQRRAAQAAQAAELRAVAHWADLQRDVLDEPSPREAPPEPGRVTGDRELGRAGVLHLATGEEHWLPEFAVPELAAALGMSEPAARAYVARAWEVRDRLPRLWSRVMTGVLPAWMARRIAEHTLPLTDDAAAYVDRQLAPFAARLSLRRVLAIVEAAVLRFDPAAAAQRAKAAGERRGVWVDDDLDGTSTITAVTTTPTAAAFEASVHQVATVLKELGDTGTEQVRRARALGVLADPQQALDLAAGLRGGSSTESTARPAAQRLAGSDRPVLHVHLHTDALATLRSVVPGVGGSASAPPTGVARVQGAGRHGARPVAVLSSWLTELAPGATVTVTPVVDCTAQLSYDAYEVPDRLRRQVEERDDCCRFPWCGRRGRFDADHVREYVPPDDGGPPGQTSSRNLARLCRFHHRVKTHTHWTYSRRDDGTCEWTSPLGRRYTVDHTGTRSH